MEKTFQSFSNQTHYSPTDPDARISTKPGKPRQLNYLCNMAVDTAEGVITHIQADQEKKLELSYYQEEYERAWKRQQTKHFKRMVRVRAGTVEPVFDNLINYYGLRKINTKGKAGAHKCMLMSAIAFNLKKLMKFIVKKSNVKVVALQGQQLAFLKSLFTKVISSKISYLVFSTPQLRFK